jgi:hypothetical protein
MAATPPVVRKTTFRFDAVTVPPYGGKSIPDEARRRHSNWLASVEGRSVRREHHQSVGLPDQSGKGGGISRERGMDVPSALSMTARAYTQVSRSRLTWPQATSPA